MGGLIAVILTVATALPAQAARLDIDGPLIQGGLAIGRVDPGTRVAVGRQRVRVSADGVFLVGFGRDAPAKVRVRATFPGGATIIRTVKVAPRDYKVQRIDGLPPRHVTPTPDDLVRIRADSAAIAAARATDTDDPLFLSKFVWPVRGRVSGVFGSQRILNGEARRPHSGVDVAAPHGTPVVAAATGVVVLAHGDMYFTGKTVVIDHGHGLTSVYAHMSGISVERGRRVAKGEPIGRVGTSGRATGPHLHWGVALFKTHLDPALLVGPMPKAP
jgi:murein DD-endopeptidase MepM/ murein hydrolase activator NlpD